MKGTKQTPTERKIACAWLRPTKARRRVLFVQPAPYFYPWCPPNYTALMSYVHVLHPSWEPLFFGMAPWPGDRLALENRSKWEHPWHQGRFSASLWSDDGVIPDFTLGPASFHSWLTKEAQRVLALDPDLIAFSSSLSDWMYGLPLLARIRALSPQCPIVGGGPHLTLIGRLVLQHGFRRAQFVLAQLFDGLVFGEGERALSQVLSAIDEDRDWSHVPGMSVRIDDRLLPPKHPAKALCLDALPSPQFQLFSRQISSYTTPTLETSRGCTSKCSFCSVRSFWPGFRVKSFPKLKSDVDQYLAAFPARPAVRFVDTTLDPRLPSIRQLFEYVRSRGAIPWSSFVRIADLTEDVLDLLATSGCHRLAFGVETGNDLLLSLIGKKHSCAEAERAVERCLAHGITPVPSVIIGLPEETRDHAVATLALAERLVRVYGCSELVVEEFLPVPGSPYVDDGRVPVATILSEESSPTSMAIAPHVWFKPSFVPWRCEAYECALGFANRVDFFPTHDLGLT